MSLQERRGLKFEGGEQNRPPLDILLQLCGDLGSGSCTKQAVIPIRQAPGMMIRVPPGYIHLVHNITASVKVAWDFYKPSNFHLYLQALQIAEGKYFGNENAPDYMSVPSLLVELVNAFVELPQA